MARIRDLVPSPKDLDVPERREGYLVIAFLALIFVATLLLLFPIRDPASSALGILTGGFILFSVLLLLAILFVGRGTVRAVRGFRRR